MAPFMAIPAAATRSMAARSITQALKPLACIALLGLLVGCQRPTPPAEQEQQQLEQEAAERRLDAEVERCQARREDLQTLADQLTESEAALERLAARRYSPAARPPGPDPQLLERLSMPDRELEQERHQQALQAWQEQERARRARWQSELERERRQVQARRNEQLQALAALNPALVETQTAGEGHSNGRDAAPRVQASVLAAYLSCDRQALAKVAQED